MDRNRRDFILQSSRNLALAALAHAFPGILLLSRADESAADDRFFVLLRTSGGMDCTLGLDPQILPEGADASDMFLEYRPDDILRPADGAGRIALGPAASALAPFAGRIAVINGVMMRRDAGHESCLNYLVTGNGSGLSAALPIELAATVGAAPFGVVIDDGTPSGARAVILSRRDDLKQNTDRHGLMDILDYSRRVWGGSTAGTPLEDATAALTRMRGVSDALARELARHPSPTPAQTLAAAFASGASRQAQLNISNVNLDTHSNHEGEHLRGQSELWKQVAEVFAAFQNQPYRAGNLFDRTTFMVVSEFSRTPALNAAKGKDHNPFTNSVLLAGRGVRGGFVQGASKIVTRGQSRSGDPLHIAAPFDFAAGRIAERREGASFIYPENVARTVARIFGDPAGFSSVPMETLPVPGIALD